MRKVLPCLVAFALLVPTLVVQSIWWDEGISMHLAALPWGEIIAERAANIHPPLYFLILKGWSTVAGHTPFAARYLSALAATLLPAAVYGFSRRRLGVRSARAAALLVALGTPFIVYGQEVRAYAALPLLLVGLWAQVWPVSRRTASVPSTSTARASQWREMPGWKIRSPVASGLLLGATMAAIVLLHYAGVIAAGVAVLALGLTWLRRRDRPSGMRLLIGGGSALVLLLPWGITLLHAGLSGMGAQAGLSNALAKGVSPGYVAELLGIFHTVGLPKALGDPALVRPSLLVGALLFVGLGTALARRATRRRVLPLLALWLMPFIAAPVIWALSPQSHPRYLYPFILGGWVLVGALVSSRGLPRLVRLGLLAGVLATGELGMLRYLGDPDYARTDVRGVAATIRAQARPGDLVVIPKTDWSLPQYDLGDAQVLMVPDPADEAQLLRQLAVQTAPGVTVFALDYPRGVLDPRGALRATLVSAGELVARQRIGGVDLETYTLRAAVRAPASSTVDRACLAGTAFCLTGAVFDGQPLSGAAMSVRLDWSGTPSRRLYVALRLYTGSGILVASHDDLLVDAALRPSDLWGPQATTTYHVIPLPIGMLPQAYRLEVGLFEPDHAGGALPLAPGDVAAAGARPAIVLGEVVPLAEPWRDTSLYGLSPGPEGPEMQVPGGAFFAGGALDRGEAAPGQQVYVALAWRVAGDANRPGAEPLVVLRQAGRDLVAVPVPPALAGLPEGRPVVQHLALPIPSEADEGYAQVVLLLADQTIDLGTVHIAAAAHDFELPSITFRVSRRARDVATLVGFDVAPDTALTPGAPVTVTLVWRAEAGAAARSLKVFVHLVDSTGAIVAQHDAVPAFWSRPTEGWVDGEYIVDAHPLDWHTADVTGPLTLSVGLYDEATGTRIPWDDGADALTLDVHLDVIPKVP